MFNKLRKVAISVATSGALVLALGGGLASSAVAQEQGQADQMDNAVGPATAVQAKKGNIHVVKYENSTKMAEPTGAQAGDGKGKQAIPDGSTPLGGVEFTLTPITKAPGIPNVAAAVKSVDNDQLKALAALTGPDVEKALANPGTDWAFDKANAKKNITSDEGKIDWTGLDLGVYLLQETNSVVTLDDGTTKAYKKSPASLIFLPTTNPTGDGWLTEGNKYAVWVYPKNSIDDNLKSVDDQNKQVGDNITYTISASIPAVPTDAQKEAGVYDLNNFAFWDNLAENLQLLDTTSVAVKVGVPTADGKAPDNATALDASTEFVAKVYAGANADKNAPGTAVDPATKDGGQKLAVVLTPAGVTAVAGAKRANSEAKVFLAFSPKVIKSGIVANKAQVYKTYAGEAESVDTDNIPFNAPTGLNTFATNAVVSAWGKIVVTKTDEKDNPLAGATFEVYGVKTEEGKDVVQLKANGEKNNLFKGQTFTSDADGHVTIDGLHANNLENSGAEVKGYTKYALVETQAPAGYELSRAPIFFTIDVKTEVAKVIADASWKIDEDGVVTLADAADAALKAEVAGATPADIAASDASLHRTATVVNIPVKPRLPLTGGAGIAIFGLLGGGLLLGGLYAAKRNSRQAK